MVLKIEKYGTDLTIVDCLSVCMDFYLSFQTTLLAFIVIILLLKYLYLENALATKLLISDSLVK